MTYNDSLVLDRVGAAHISSDLDKRADDHDGKVPRSVPEPSKVCNGNEQKTVRDTSNDGKWKVGLVHPHRLLVVGHGDSVGWRYGKMVY